MENKFTVTFGQLPSSYINRERVSDKICNDFCLDFPLSHIYIISGVRDFGKTVLLTNASKNIEKKKVNCTQILGIRKGVLFYEIFMGIQTHIDSTCRGWRIFTKCIYR